MKKHSTFYNLFFIICSNFLQFRRDSLGLYVGSGAAKEGAIEKFKEKECPIECRPANHKDWKYC